MSEQRNEKLVTVSEERLNELLQTEKMMGAFEKYGIRKWEHYCNATNSVQNSIGRVKLLDDTSELIAQLLSEGKTSEDAKDKLHKILSEFNTQYALINIPDPEPN